MQATNNRIVDVSECGAYLKVSLERLIIERDGEEALAIPLVDLAALIVSHPQVRYSNAVLAGVAAAGGTFVTCDAKHMPAAMLMPLAGHHLQSERFARQASASLPVRKRVWQQIVRAKLKAQSGLLVRLRGDDKGIAAMIPKVRSGDPANVEAQAARRYWPALFADKAFRRDPDGGDANAHLNYGYAVLRAIVARAICGAGLHPSLGIYHHNRYNTFCLADDLMEPFRPLVDEAVVRRVQDTGLSSVLDKEAKAQIIGSLMDRFTLDGEMRSLFDILARVAVSLADVFAGARDALALPELGFRSPG